VADREQHTVGHGDEHRAGDACPACGVAVMVPRDKELGEILWCDNCGMALQIVSLAPFLLELHDEEQD
jgi:lysine biosynthesis protein LysW